MDHSKQYEQIIAENQRIQEEMRELTRRYSWFLNKPVSQSSPAKENSFGNVYFEAHLHRTFCHRAPFEQSLPPLAEHQRGLPLRHLSTSLSETLLAQLMQRTEDLRRNRQIVQRIHSQFRTLNSLRSLKQICSSKELFSLSGRLATVAGINSSDSSTETLQKDGCSRKSAGLTDQSSHLINAASLDDVNCLEQASDLDTCVTWLNDISLSIPKCSKQEGLGRVTDSVAVSTSDTIPRLVLK